MGSFWAYLQDGDTGLRDGLGPALQGKEVVGEEWRWVLHPAAGKEGRAD